MTTSMINPPVVAGVDGSPSALQAVLWAADEAAARRAPLRIVHTGDAEVFGYFGELAPPQSYFDAIDARGNEILLSTAAEVRRAYPDLAVETSLHNANPLPVLIEESREARLMVLGARGTGGFPGILTGSTALDLVAHGHCPVAVVRGRTPDDAPPTAGPVVVGVDGSPTSEAAIAAAFDEASFRGADLVAVHAWNKTPPDHTHAYVRSLGIEGDILDVREHEQLAERLAGWQEKYPDVPVRRVVSREHPTQCLLQQAADARLLVVGSRGHGEFTGMLLGSTSRALLSHATCPLLVVRPVATP